MPPPSKATFGYSPSKVNFPKGASIRAQSPTFAAFKAKENSWSKLREAIKYELQD